MILTGPIVLSLFLAALGLMMGLSATAIWLRHTMHPAPHADGAPDRAYLVFLLLLTAFGLRVIAWPLSYFALDSAIPHVSGAMCIFGVTRLVPLWANLAQAVRPLLLLAQGGWIVLRMSSFDRERSSPERALKRPVVERSLLLVTLVLLIVDCLLEFTVLLSLRPGIPVFCCGSVYDLPDRFSSLIPGSLLGAQHARLLLPLLYLSGLLLAGMCLVSGLAVRNVGLSAGRRRLLRTAAVLLVPLQLLFFVAVAFIASMEVVAPRLTGLPYHHCLYCLLGKTVSGPWMAAVLACAMLLSAWGMLLFLEKQRNARRTDRTAGALLITGGLLTLLYLAITALAAGGQGAGRDLGPCAACAGRLFDTVYLVEVVMQNGEPSLLCSAGCALGHIRRHGGRSQVAWVTVRDEFTGERLDSGAAFFVEAPESIRGLPLGNHWHAYQYLENAHIMAFRMDGNIVKDPFRAGGEGGGGN